jgi:hypothetical protein
VRALLVAVVLAAVACKPSPDDFSLAVRGGSSLAADAKSVTLVDGDVLVLDVKPDDPDNLCVTATSSAPEFAEVRRVTGQCQRFAILPKGEGETRSATITFTARDFSEELRVDVSAASAP